MEIRDDDLERLSGGRNRIREGMASLLSGYTRLAGVWDVFMLLIAEFDALGVLAVDHLPDSTRASVTEATMEEVECDGRLIASSEGSLRDRYGLTIQVADVALVRCSHESLLPLLEMDSLRFERDFHAVLEGHGDDGEQIVI